MAEPSTSKDRSGWFLAAVFIAVIVSFFATTAIGQATTAAVDTAARTLITKSTPSIEHLAALRSEAHHAETLLARLLESGAAGAPAPKLH